MKPTPSLRQSALLVLAAIAAPLLSAQDGWFDFDPPKDAFTDQALLDLRFLNEDFESIYRSWWKKALTGRNASGQSSVRETRNENEKRLSTIDAWGNGGGGLEWISICAASRGWGCGLC